jgi:hypothetical protein
MSERWFRFYEGVPHDPKILRLTDKQYRLWTYLLCFASAGKGILPPIADLETIMRLPRGKLRKTLEELQAAGLIDETADGLTPHNWHRRQFKSDVSTERVNKWRERHRNVSSNVARNVSGNGSGNVAETPPDTDTDTETDTETDDRNRPDSDQIRGRGEAVSKDSLTDARNYELKVGSDLTEEQKQSIYEMHARAQARDARASHNGRGAREKA